MKLLHSPISVTRGEAAEGGGGDDASARRRTTPRLPAQVLQAPGPAHHRKYSSPHSLPSVRPLAPPSPVRQATGPALPRPSGQWLRSVPDTALPARHALPQPVGIWPRPPPGTAPPLLAGRSSLLGWGPCLNLGFASPPRLSCAGCEAPASRPRNSRARAERRGCVAAPWPRRRGAACAAAGTAGQATFLSRRCRPYSWTRSTWVRASRLDPTARGGGGQVGGDHVTTPPPGQPVAWLAAATGPGTVPASEGGALHLLLSSQVLPGEERGGARHPCPGVGCHPAFAESCLQHYHLQA